MNTLARWWHDDTISIGFRQSCKWMGGVFRLIGTIALTAAAPLQACIVDSPLKPADVKYADAVITGRILNYRIIRDQKFRNEMLANPNLSKEERAYYRSGEPLMSDYALFDISVDRIWAGKAAAKVQVKWRNESFGLPKRMGAGPFLIALTYPNSTKRLPMWGAGADRTTMLQAPCSSPFLFEMGSKDAQAVLKKLNQRPHSRAAGIER